MKTLLVVEVGHDLSFPFRIISRLDSSSSGIEEIPTESLSFATFSSLKFRL
jgi:hypothetical protein